jgi:hypothetical protein
MSGTVWIKHPELDAVSEVPAASLAGWRQSGWDLLSDEELADREQAAVADRDEAERRMQEFAGQGAELTPPPLEAPEPPIAPALSSEDATPGRRINKKETG